MFQEEHFSECMVDLIDLSTLITKNRGINYRKSVQQDHDKLQGFISKYGTEITDHHYDKAKGFDLTKKPTTDLQKARILYYKFIKEECDVSIAKEYSKLLETTEVMNFECDDTICMNA